MVPFYGLLNPPDSLDDADIRPHRPRNELRLRGRASPIYSARPLRCLAHSPHACSSSLLFRLSSSSRDNPRLFKPRHCSRSVHRPTRSLNQGDPEARRRQLRRDGFLGPLAPLPPPTLARRSALEPLPSSTAAKEPCCWNGWHMGITISHDDFPMGTCVRGGAQASTMARTGAGGWSGSNSRSCRSWVGLGLQAVCRAFEVVVEEVDWSGNRAHPQGVC